MMLRRFRIFMMAVAVAALPSCKAISSLIHDGEVAPGWETINSIARNWTM